MGALIPTLLADSSGEPNRVFIEKLWEAFTKHLARSTKQNLGADKILYFFRVVGYLVKCVSSVSGRGFKSTPVL